MVNDFAQIISFLNQLVDNSKILVVGDVMLDKYYYGEVQRISPEAPVPIARVKEVRETLGGAANVAHNLALIGCKVLLGGTTGEDDSRNHLCRLLRSKGIDHTGLLVTNNPTTTKLRVIGAHQQMMRLDFEEISIFDGEIERQLECWIGEALKNGVNGVVISDYAKGICTPRLCRYIINGCAVRDIPVLIDPKGADWEKYMGATFITPNLKELGEAIKIPVENKDEIVEMYAVEVKERFNIKNIVVTRSEKGLSLINNTKVEHIPTKLQEVFDVSGAGDTVAAMLIATVASGLDPIDAAHLANLAAGIVVGKLGTYAISKAELIDTVQHMDGGQNWGRKIVNCTGLVQLVEKWRGNGQSIVFTNGCFDILHAGHVEYLERSKKLGSRLVVGLNSDASVRRIKGLHRPINSEIDRAKLLNALECVDCVVLFDEDTPTSLIRALKPDVLVKGGDYRVEEVVGREFAKRVQIIPLEDGYSTSEVIKRVLEKHSRQDICDNKGSSLTLTGQ